MTAVSNWTWTNSAMQLSNVTSARSSTVARSQHLDNWQQIITIIQDISTKETRLGIPNIYGIDAIHGVNYTVGATLFPQSIAMAATGNIDLVRIEGEITAREMRACGLAWNFNPVLDLGRQPLWSRLWEGYGEDPWLCAQFGAAYIQGQQGDNIAAPDRVATCMKHYLGYSTPLSGKDRTPAWIPDRMLRELYLPPFAAAVKAGTPTVMVNSSEINGIPVHSSRYILTEILRDELGFDGFVVTDWEDIKNLYTREKVAANNREAVKMAVMAGVDMAMVPYDYSFTDDLIDLVKSGEVPMARIDEAVTRILRSSTASASSPIPAPAWSSWRSSPPGSRCRPVLRPPAKQSRCSKTKAASFRWPKTAKSSSPAPRPTSSPSSTAAGPSPGRVIANLYPQDR